MLGNIATLDVRSCEPGERPAERVRGSTPPSERPAYLLYTSGSTGRAKGVLVSHRSLVNHATAMARRFALVAQDRVLQFATLSFDVAAEEIFPTLAAGATLVLRGDEDLSHDALLRLDATVLNLPTSYFHSWTTEMRERGARVPASVRLLVVGSEAALPNRLAQWMDLGGDRVHFINAYGPTEATISATAFAIAPGEQLPVASIPIGRPIENVTTYVLDARLEPLPVGVPGELWIGGEGVAIGYFERPELTRERFVPNPFGPGRLYRTGDLARWSPQGLLELLGRVDFQVKIRGYRIELGEIESALRTASTVKDAVVVAREVAGDRRLAAYVVPHVMPAHRELQAALTTELRAHLGRQLPSYLLPPDIVLLDALPMTMSQKVDRRALPAPEQANTEARIGASHGPSHLPANTRGPRDALELRLVSIWEDLLGRAPIGLRESFFDLGGHSLLAVRLMARIRTVIGHDLALSTLFEKPTIEELAKLLRNGPARAMGALVAIQPNGSRPPLFCVHPAGGNVLCFASLAQALGRDQPLYGLQSAGLAGNGALDDTVEAMASRYLAALREVQPQGPYHLLGYSVGGTIAYAMAAELRAQGEAVPSLTLLDAPAPARLAADGESALGDFAREHGIAVDEAELRALGEEEALLHVLRAAVDADVLPDDIDLPTIRRLLQVMTVNVRAACAYRPQACTGMSVTLIRAGEAADQDDASLGWADFVDGGLTIRRVEGDHASILTQPHVANVARLVAPP
jgi:amino acid adenylation domain-containing protein